MYLKQKWQHFNSRIKTKIIYPNKNFQGEHQLKLRPPPSAFLENKIKQYIKLDFKSQSITISTETTRDHTLKMLHWAHRHLTCCLSTLSERCHLWCHFSFEHSHKMQVSSARHFEKMNRWWQRMKWNRNMEGRTNGPVR